MINNNLNKAMGHCYYSIRDLYATCKSFQWMLTLECVCVEKGKDYHYIVTRNINGNAHGMFYDINKFVVEYALFEDGIQTYISTRCKHNLSYYNKNYMYHNYYCEQCLLYSDGQDFLYKIYPYLKQIMNKDNGYVMLKYKK